MVFMKLRALKRDNYCCVVSKLKDWKYYNRELDKSKIKTEATHILPFSLNNLTSNQMWSRKPRVWQIIEMFSQVQLDEFNGQDINRLENVLTLSSDLHSLFGELNIWFKPVESRPNCYTLETASIVEGFPSIVVPAAGTIVEFTTPDPTDLPLPDSRYLALHAACAQVSHASGAAEYIDELLCDMEDRTVLASDGSSSKLLDHALSLVNAFV
ncbi:hypothetical protein FRB99_006318 [Tulasnella sp. 403]|nr:hypothetical protein FRB99_006318 [Tulasnella sp. 403]